MIVRIAQTNQTDPTNHRLSVRFVAADDETRARGLMHADPLADDETALFVFAQTGRHGFWNKNVSFGLSLAFCDDQFRIVHLADMDAHSERPTAPPSDNVRYVIEAKQGTWDRIGAKTGDVVAYENRELIVRLASAR